jgi:predicted nucleic acid-binding Zn finger protein
MKLSIVSITKSMIAFVTPKSKKAQNRFCNLMNRNDKCIVEQHQGTKVFLTSANGKNHFWVNLMNDEDWNVELN